MGLGPTQEEGNRQDQEGVAKSSEVCTKSAQELEEDIPCRCEHDAAGT